MSVPQRLAAAVFAFAIVHSPKIALACSVCSAGKDEENADAFLMMTIVMSILPPLMIGALLYGIVRRIRAHEKANELKPADLRPPVAPLPSSKSA